MSRRKSHKLLDQPEAARVLIPFRTSKHIEWTYRVRGALREDWTEVNQTIRASQGHQNTGSIQLATPNFQVTRQRKVDIERNAIRRLV